MTALLSAAGTVASLVALTHGAWWTLLSAIALPRPRNHRAPQTPWRFAVVVPAHNEELLLSACLESLASAPFTPRPEVVVVADNCTDSTAEVARQAGATVLERDDPGRRGKSYALEFAIAHLAARPEPPAAVLFVDADTQVSDRFFTAVAARFEAGAKAVQVHYVAGAGETSLARLRRLAFLLVHWSRPLGAHRLGLGTGLKGNGMALRWDIAKEGLGGTGITEDAAMTLALAARGIPVAFEAGASVRGHMASGYEAATTQDERWERGRLSLVLPGLRTTLGALFRGRFAAAAAAAEVATLPLTLLVAASGAGLVLAVLGFGSGWLAISSAVSLASYVAVGLVAARPPLRDLAALASAPRFILHKAGVYASLVRRPSAGWQRTDRR